MTRGEWITLVASTVVMVACLLGIVATELHSRRSSPACPSHIVVR